MLDPLRHRGERRQDLERVESRPAAAQRVAAPDAGEAAGFDLSDEAHQAIHEPAIGARPVLIGGSADPDHRTDAHEALSQNFSVTETDRRLGPAG
jgi:hypothetical protein